MAEVVNDLKRVGLERVRDLELMDGGVVLLLSGQEHPEREVRANVILSLLRERPRKFESLFLLAGAKVRLGQVEENLRALWLHSAEVSYGTPRVVPGQQKQSKVVVCVAITRVVTQSCLKFPLGEIELVLCVVCIAQAIMRFRRLRVDSQCLLKGGDGLRKILLLVVDEAEEIQTRDAVWRQLQSRLHRRQGRIRVTLPQELSCFFKMSRRFRG